MMRNVLKKMSSRKMWAAVIGVIVGAATIFGLDADAVQTVAGAVIAAGSVVSYIMAEGRVDEASVRAASEKLSDAAKALADEEDTRA